MSHTDQPGEDPSASWIVRSGLVSREVVLGAVGAIGLTYGIYILVRASLVEEPGNFGMAFGQLFGGGIALASVLPLGWALNQVCLAHPSLRLRALAWIGLALVGSAFWFRSQTIESVAELREDEYLEAFTAPVRHDFESDLADAFRAWFRDQGTEGSAYLGNYLEMWSLDPNGDGQVDADAPVLRALRDMGWSELGLTLFDSDADLIVDQLEFTPSTGTEPETVCMPLVYFDPEGPDEEGLAGLYLVEYHNAVRGRCDALPSTNVLGEP